jgi:hypothetical protein
VSSPKLAAKTLRSLNLNGCVNLRNVCRNYGSKKNKEQKTEKKFSKRWGPGFKFFQEAILGLCKSKNSTLETLCLFGCTLITDESIGSVAKNCKNLKHLNLASTKITDSSLKQLASCSTLQSLRLDVSNFFQKKNNFQFFFFPFQIFRIPELIFLSVVFVAERNRLTERSWKTSIFRNLDYVLLETRNFISEGSPPSL